MSGRGTKGFAAALVVALVSQGSRIAAQPPGDHPLGTVSFPVSCSAPAQVEFNRAVALLHHMTYPPARAAFQHVAEIDPQCAMAPWGEAMTLFQPLWPTRPRPEALQRGFDLVAKAKALAPPTDLERRFIGAAEAFFLQPASPDYWLRIRRWEAAADTVHTSFPDDAEAAAFYALAHLANAQASGNTRAAADRAAEILLDVYRHHPDHPGALHYLIHANDVPGREQELLDLTRQYEAVAPHNPHALHMPTHIYTRLGDWIGVIRGNRLAAEAALGQPAGDHGELVWDEFPHAIEYLVYGYLQRGADHEAAAQWERLRTTARLEPSFKTAFHLASVPARYALERQAWAEAAALAPRTPATLEWDRFAWPEAIAQFAHGLGAVHRGRLAESRAAIDRLAHLDSTMRQAGEDLFSRNIRVLRLELRAWTAEASGQRDSSVALMRQAVDLEAATPKHAVTPGPTLPALEQLGDLLLKQRRPTEALDSYQRSLLVYPNRFNSLLGAAQAARAAGDPSAARGYYQQLVDLAGEGSRRGPIEEARKYLSMKPGSRPIPH